MIPYIAGKIGKRNYIVSKIAFKAKDKCSLVAHMHYCKYHYALTCRNDPYSKMVAVFVENDLFTECIAIAM